VGAEPRESSPRTVNVDSAGVDEVGVVPWPSLVRRRLADRVPIERNWALLIVVLSGLFTIGVTFTILVVELQTIAREFDSTVSVISWAITGPMLAFGVVGPAYGKAGDLWGHKRVFVFGLLGAGLFAALTAVAWSAASMVAFRILSATAGAATGPATMAYINRLFPPEQRVRPLGYWSFVNAGAPVIGVVAGVPLVDAVGWRAIFAVQAPLCVIGVLLAWRLLPDTERVSDVRFDVWGSLTLGLGALMMLTGVNQGPKWGWASPAVVLLLAGSVAVLVLFVRIERRVSDPLMPLRWMRTRNFVVPVASQAFANFAYMGGLLLSPLVMSEILGYDSGRISLVIIARPLTFALLAPLASLATIRIGERQAAMFGWSCILASMLAFMFVDESSGVMLMVAALALSGAGFGIAGPALTSLVANSVDERDLGVAGAMQQLVNQMGSVFGSVVMTTIQVATVGAGLETSYHVTFAVAAAVAGVAVILAAFVRSTPRTA